MTSNQRNVFPGGSFFFTANLVNRKRSLWDDYFMEIDGFRCALPILRLLS